MKHGNDMTNRQFRRYETSFAILIHEPTWKYHFELLYITCSLAVGERPPTYTRLACRVAYMFGTSKKGQS